MATFSSYEADLLRSLAAQLIELLSDGRDWRRPEPSDPFAEIADLLEASAHPVPEPDDPVLARLLPTAYREDPDAAADFRRFTETDLRRSKIDGAEAVISTLEEAGLGEHPQADEVIDVELDHGDALVWMRTLTDLRLAIGTRLGVQDGDEDYWQSLPDDDPRAHIHDIYDWLAFLQETLVGSLTPRRFGR